MGYDREPEYFSYRAGARAPTITAFLDYGSAMQLQRVAFWTRGFRRAAKPAGETSSIRNMLLISFVNIESGSLIYRDGLRVIPGIGV